MTKVDLFTMDGDKKAFQATNKMWNAERYNDPYLWGYVSQLVDKKDFKTKDEWLDYYYQSGEERLNKIKNLPREWREQLTKFTTMIPDLPKWVLNYNYQYGRTEAECKEMASKMFDKRVKYLRLGINEDEWEHMVYHRVFGETWNGIVAREKNTAIVIENKFPNMVLKKISGEDDYKFAIDYEMYSSDKLLGAIQIKPRSYLNSKSDYILKAKRANEKKNKLYTEEKKVPVFYVYSEHNGRVTNPEVFVELENLLKKEKTA